MHDVLTHQQVKTLTLKDNRTLGYAEVGDPQGKPLFLFHGLHSSRLEVALVAKKMQKKGIRLIAVDRVGIGLSTFRENHTLFDTVDDVVELANHLNIEKFSVLGTSSGAKYAWHVPREYLNDSMLFSV
jgi:pimeloyl-ACP methyl ester carboxylesterase